MMTDLPNLPEWVQHVLFPLARWIHLVCTTLLVGGTLFYEFVVPRALEDLPDEVQLAVLGRVRWVFRRIVVLCVALLVLSGGVAVWQDWPTYHVQAFRELRPWTAVHVVAGGLALYVGWWAVRQRRAPHVPLVMMRVNFVVLLIVVFLAVVGRHIRISVQENILHDNPEVFDEYRK